MSLSGNSVQMQKEENKNVQIDEFIQKPVSLSAIKKMLQKYI